jgi:hypothetical protein
MITRSTVSTRNAIEAWVSSVREVRWRIGEGEVRVHTVE